MSKQIADQLNEALPVVIQSCVSEHDQNRIVTRSLVMIESITDDGSRTLTFFPDKDMRAWDVLGFIEYLRAITNSYALSEGD